jgi:hypothetical protein
MRLRSSIFLIVSGFALTIPGTRGQENLLSPESAVAICPRRKILLKLNSSFGPNMPWTCSRSAPTDLFKTLNPQLCPTGAPTPTHFPPKAMSRA